MHSLHHAFQDSVVGMSARLARQSISKTPRLCSEPGRPRAASSKLRLSSTRAALTSVDLQARGSTSSFDYLPSLDTETRISIQIASARTLSELSAVLSTGNYVDSMNHSHVSAIVEAMPRTLANQMIGHTERLIVQRMLKQLNALASMYLHRFETLEITALLQGWAQLQHIDPRLQSPDSVLTSLLLDLLITDIDCLTHTQLVSCTWSIGRLGIRLTRSQGVQLLGALQYHMAAFDAEDHVQVAEGLAVAGCSIPRPWSYEWQVRTARLPGTTAQQAASLLKSAADLAMFDQGMSPEWVDAMMAKLRGGMTPLGSAVVAQTFTAAATLATPASVQPKWADELLAAAAHTMFARRKLNPLASFSDTLPPPVVTPDELSKVAAALGALGVRPMDNWLVQFVRTVGYKLPSFEPAHVAALVWGLAMVDYHPDHEFLLQLKGEIECRLQEFDASEASKVAWALGVFSMNQQQQQRQKYGE